VPPQDVTEVTPFQASCQGSALGQVQTSTLDSAITSVAPDKAAPGSTFSWSLTPDPMPIPSSAGGQTIQNLSNVRIRIPVPAGSTFASATLSGGSNLGSGTPTVTQSAGVITLTVPGPLAAGTTAVLPTVNVNLQASGSTGTVLNAILAGNSYANPGITFTVKIVLFGLSVSTNCFVSPSPVFATTTIQ